MIKSQESETLGQEPGFFVEWKYLIVFMQFLAPVFR